MGFMHSTGIELALGSHKLISFVYQPALYNIIEGVGAVFPL